jgi:hypothetical protein
VRGVLGLAVVLGLFVGPAGAVSLTHSESDFSTVRADSRDASFREMGRPSTTLAEDRLAAQCLHEDAEYPIDARVQDVACFHAFPTDNRVKPVPEPDGFVLLALGAATLLIRFWRNVGRRC